MHFYCSHWIPGPLKYGYMYRDQNQVYRSSIDRYWNFRLASIFKNGRKGQHREYHSWESTEENDTTPGGSWGGGCMGTPVGLWTNFTDIPAAPERGKSIPCFWRSLDIHWNRKNQNVTSYTVYTLKPISLYFLSSCGLHGNQFAPP